MAAFPLTRIVGVQLNEFSSAAGLGSMGVGEERDKGVASSSSFASANLQPCPVYPCVKLKFN